MFNKSYQTIDNGWQSCLVSIPKEWVVLNFYIFKGVRKSRAFLERTRGRGTILIMQKRGFMTKSYLKNGWSIFLFMIESMYGISPTNWHLLILDGSLVLMLPWMWSNLPWPRDRIYLTFPSTLLMLFSHLMSVASSHSSKHSKPTKTSRA